MNEERQVYLTPAGLKRIKKLYRELRRHQRGRGEKKRSRLPMFFRDKVGDADPDILVDDELLAEQLQRYQFILKHYRLITPRRGKDKSKIALGSTVTIELDGQEQEFQILDFPEADPEHGKISYFSPLAKALMGRSVGEEVKIQVDPPRLAKIKKIEYKVPKI